VAIDLTAEQFRAALRTAGTTEENAEADRILATVRLLVEKRAPNAPTTIQNEAAIRAGGWLFDMDPAQRAAAGDVLRNSGAGALLHQWRSPRARSTGK